MKKYVWMMVSTDALRLPIAVANSAKELARITGKSEVSIKSAVSHAKDGKRRSCYERVEIDEEDDDQWEN